MSNPRTINQPGNGTDTQQFELAPGLLQYVQSVYVEIDNSAGSDARPTLTLSEQSGVVIAKKRQSESIPAGGTGSGTWALRLDDKSGATLTGVIRYKVANTGDWLTIAVTGVKASTFDSFNLNVTGIGVTTLQTNGGGDFRIYQNNGFLDIQAGHLALSSFDSGNTCDLNLEGGMRAYTNKAHSFSFYNRFPQLGDDATLEVAGRDSTNVHVVRLTAGKRAVVLDSAGNTLFEVDENGDLHGKTGKSLVFDR